MTAPLLSPAAIGIVDWLGELGPRWGLPPGACRVHGMLFLLARPVAAQAIAAELAMTSADVDLALAWLADESLVARTAEGWSTQADPWALILRTLEQRRARELVPARAVLTSWQRPSGEDPIVARQAKRLADLVEDLAAIDAGARRLSPSTMRRMVAAGGRAARMLDRTFGGGRRR